MMRIIPDIDATPDPIHYLGRWLEDARRADAPAPTAMTLATVGEDGHPSARVVSLKRLEDEALVFTTALWTRKAEEIADLDPLRARLDALQTDLGDDPIACPAEWGAVRIRPQSVELWEQGPDRLHDRSLFELTDDGWRRSRLAP